MSTIDSSAKRFGPVWLAPNISRMNVWIFLYSNFIIIGFLIFINIGQAYILSENLGIPDSALGAITGDLAFITEVTIVLTISVFGLLSDRVSRRHVYAGGLALIGLAYVFYPIADSVAELTIYRFFYAVGVASTTCLMTIITHDYVQEPSRGKLVAMCGIMGSLGAVLISAVFGYLPKTFQAQGVDAISAGQYTHWIAAIVCIGSALLILVGLKEGTPAKKEERSSVRELIQSVLREGRKPRVSLAYSTAFMARGDMVIVGTFIVLWGSVAGHAQGMETADALGRGTMLFVTASAAGLFWAPVMGFLMDRFNRVTGVIFGTGLASIAFLSMSLIDNPFDPLARPLFILLGIGQVSCFWTSQALIGQEAPAKERGTLVGAFSLFGAIGVMITAALGGRLFDAVGPSGPFVLVGFGSLAVCCFAIVVRLRAPGRMPNAAK